MIKIDLVTQIWLVFNLAMNDLLITETLIA